MSLKTQAVFFSSLMVLLFISTTTVTGNFDHAHEEESVNQCEKPQSDLTVIGGDGVSANKFDAKEYNVEKASCYRLVFQNIDLIGHDINIDIKADDGDINNVHIAIEGKSGGDNADGIGMLNFLTPSVDTEFSIYCSIKGHESMVATLIVGAGLPAENDDASFLPGFEVSLIVLSLISLISIRRFKK